MKKNNKPLFFETPEEKCRVFQAPRLVMFSNGTEVASWENTQPLYFFPFTWLDYLKNKGTRELLVYDCDPAFAERQILLLNRGKVHLERPDLPLMRIAKERGHKVSVICNLEDLTQEHISALSHSDFVRVRIDRNHSKLPLLSHLPNEGVLSCVKFYVGEGVSYHDLALHIRDMGFDFIHVTRRLASCSGNYPISETEKETIMKLKELETKKFRVIIPSSLEQQFAKRFLITPEMGNVSSCLFSAYRTVLKGNSVYPCYTQRILDQDGVKEGEQVHVAKDCLDCACIYENDMLSNIRAAMERYKRPTFALEYHDN